MSLASQVSSFVRSRSPKLSSSPLSHMHKKYKDPMSSTHDVSLAKLSGSPVPILGAKAKRTRRQKSPVKQAIDAFEKRARGSPVLQIAELQSVENDTAKDFASSVVDDKRPSLATRRSILLDPLKVDSSPNGAVPGVYPEFSPPTKLDECAATEGDVIEGVPDDVEFDTETIGQDVDFLRRKVSQLEQAYTRLREKEAVQRRLRGARSRECRALHGQVSVESNKNQSLAKENEMLRSKYNELWDECAFVVQQQHLSVPLTVEHKVNQLLVDKYRHEDSHWRKMKAMNRVFGGKRAMSMPATIGSAHPGGARVGATQRANTARCFRCGDHRNRRIAIDVRKTESKLNKAETSARRDSIYSRAEFCVGCFQCVKCDSPLLSCDDDMALSELGAVCTACVEPKHEEQAT